MKINKFHKAALITAIGLIFIGWMSGYDFDHRDINTGIFTFASLSIVGFIAVSGELP